MSKTYPSSITDMSTRQMIQYILKKLKGQVSSAIQSITGDLVDNTDPLNPIINLPDLPFVQSVSGNLVDDTDPLNPVINLPDPGYTVYRALLTQVGTSAPTAVILENNTGQTPALAYNVVGNYRLHHPSLFADPTKVAITISNVTKEVAAFSFKTKLVSATLVDVETIMIATMDQDGNNLENGNLNNTYIEVKIYN